MPDLATPSAAGPLGDFFCDPLSQLDDHAITLGREIESTPQPVTVDIVDGLVEAHINALLDATSTPLHGGGLATTGLIDTADVHLAWWQGRSRHRLDVTGSMRAYQLADREWFHVPMETGERHVTGPYVDSVCNNEYALTITRPVSVAGKRIGVLGFDMLLEKVEDALTPILTRISDDALLVNHDHRVIAASVGNFVAGDIASAQDLEGMTPQSAASDLPILLFTR